jgi:hypothetical protein
VNFLEPPERLTSKHWRDDDMDLVTDGDGTDYFVDVDEEDFRYWLDNLKEPLTLTGKQPVIIEYLKEMFKGQPVPDRARYPRQELKAALLERDKKLTPLNLTTLKSAIDKYNHSIRNDRNRTVSH